MEFDPTVQEGLRRSNARFMASMNRIFEKYDHPFEDDILISMSTLTFETPDGPKKWDTMSNKDITKWKKGFTQISQRPRSKEKQSRDFEDKHSAAHQESSESSGADTSDTGEESDAVASVGRKFERIRLKNLNVDDGQILEKKIVEVDVILQGDERNYPKWMMITTPRSSKSRPSTSLKSRHSTSPGQEQLGEESDAVASVGRKFERIRLKNLNVDDGQILEKKIVAVDVILQGDERNYPKWMMITTPRSSKSRRSTSSKSRHSTSPGQEQLGEESDAVASVGGKFEGSHLKNLNVDDGQILEKKIVAVDVILQGDERNYPKWMMITTPRSSKSRRSTSSKSRHSTSPGQEQLGEESDAVASVGGKFEGSHLKNLNVDDGQILEKKIVAVDVILQGDERNYPKWMMITTPRSSKSRRSTSSKSRHSTSPGQEQLGEESDAVASVGGKFEGSHLKNLNVDDGQILEKKIVAVDVILQGDERNYPKWMMITTPRSSKSRRSTSSKSRHSTSPGQEQLGEESDAVASVGGKFEGSHLKNLNVDDGQILEKKIVAVDVILQGDERNYPKWMMITTPRSSKSRRSTSSKSRHSTSPGQEQLGEESDAVASVGGKFEGSHLKNLNVDDGQILEKKIVAVDVILQGDERNYPKWMMITTPRSSKSRRSTSSKSHHSTSPGQEQLGEESDAVASVGGKFEGSHLKNLNVDDGQILEKKIVAVDVILQGDERNYPKWMMITTPRSSKSRHSTSSKSHHSTSPGQEQLGNQPICRKKLEFSNECSSSKYPQLQHSAVPISSNTVASPRHRPHPELSMTSCGSILGEYQSADEECSLSNTTLLDLYPAMVALLTKLMTKRSQRKVLKYMFRHLKSKRRPSRRPKLNVTVDKMRGFGPCKCKLKKAFHCTCSCRSEDNQNPTFGNESREFCYDSCPSSSNSSGLVPHACADTNEIKMHYSDSSLEQHLASGKSQGVCKHSAFPDVMDRMGETFLVEDKLQTTDSPKNLEYTEDEKFTYKHFSEPSFITSAASSDSRAFHLVKEKKTQKTDFHVGTSELCSSACSSHGNRNNSIPTTNCSPARSSNTMFIYPQKTTSQQKESFSSLKQNSSKRDKEIDAAFDELCSRMTSGEYLKPLTLTRPVINSQNLEEKETLVKSNQSDSERSLKQCDIEFEKLCGKSIPRSPGLQTASNFSKYEKIQIPESVNALVNSPVRTSSAIASVKRAGNFQNHPLCSPVKRLKFIPGHCFSSSKCQEISHSKEGNLQTGDMDFLSTYNCSKPSFFADHNCHCQGSGSHNSSHQSFLGIPGTSLQESGTAGAHSGWPGAMENCSSLRNVSKRHPRISRKLSYTDGKDQL